MLSASGPWSGSEISSSSFQLLEQTSACCVTFFPEGTTTIEQIVLGRSSPTENAHWRIGGTLWIRDATGDQTALLNKIWQGYDDLQSTFNKDKTLNGQVENSQLTTLSTVAGRGVTAGGHFWQTVNFVLAIDDF